MRRCEFCDKPLTGKQKRFCSHECCGRASPGNRYPQPPTHPWKAGFDKRETKREARA